MVKRLHKEKPDEIDELIWRWRKEGLTFAEVGRRLGISRQAAHWRFHRGRWYFEGGGGEERIGETLTGVNRGGEMKNYRLASDGDNLEMDCWPLFLQSQFPAYESFWQRYVVPISNRPRNIWLKADEELQQIGKGHHDVCTAQLHYTVLWHLHRAFEILASGDAMTEAQTVEGIVRLSSALDVADELLGRFANPARYDPWEDRGKAGGQGARSNWRNKLKLPETHPVRQLREYRNHLVHGRIMPSVGRDRHPAMGLQRQYFDWRKVTGLDMQASLDATHFQRRREILASAWKTTLSYLRDMWAQHLLASAGA